MLKVIQEMLLSSAELDARLLSQMLEKTPELPDWSKAVEPLLQPLLERNLINRPIVVRVLDMPFNACALPYKTVVVAKSLVDFCRDDRDQMAFILAHEVAHIHLGHAAERSRVNTLIGLLQAANPLARSAIDFCLSRAYGREQEYEADELATRLCRQAGYSPSAAITLFKRFDALGLTNRPRGSSQLLATHPPSPNRISRLQSITVSG